MTSAGHEAARACRLAVPLLALALAAAPSAAQTGIARGKVVDENQKPVAGATLLFEFRGGFEQQYEIKTNKKGEYTQIVAAGPYRITASKQDYQGAYLDHTINGGAPTDVPTLQIVSKESAIQAALEQDPVLGPLQKAMELTREGKPEEAEALYKQVLERDPSIVEARYNLGSIYVSRKDWAAAEEQFREVVALQPDLAEAKIALSRVYEELGQTEKATAVMTDAAEAHPEDARIQYSLGVLHLNAKRPEQAQAAFKKVEALDSENVKVQYLLATLALNRGDAPTAIAHLEKYLAKAPADAADRATAEELLSQLKK